MAEHFAIEQHDVLVCDNLSRGKTLAVKTMDESYNWNSLRKRFPKIALEETDLRDLANLERVAKGADLIIHTAGQVAVTTSIQDPRTDFEVNALGTFNVLETARQNDSTILFCSTNKVYGENVNRIPVREDKTRYHFDDDQFGNGIPEGFSVDHTGHSPYGSSKLSADIYVQDYAYTYGLKTGVFRMSCIYGERQLGVEDQGWMAWFVIATLTGRPITIYGNGKQVRDVLYIDDLVDIFDRFSGSKMNHGVFNIGGGSKNTLSLLELLELLRTLTGKTPKISFSDWRKADQKVYISDIRKAGKELGWKPTVRPQDGLKRTVAWARDNIKVFG
jgi:CDP-paratose 2-epimerase